MEGGKEGRREGGGREGLKLSELKGSYLKSLNQDVITISKFPASIDSDKLKSQSLHERSSGAKSLSPPPT